MEETESGEIRIIIADDQSLFAEGIKFILEARASDMKVVGLASNGEEAVRATRMHRPDIVLMDVRMPIMDGVEATGVIHAELPDVKIVMLTTFDDDEYVHSALENGAIGYLLKNRPPIELIHSIRAVRDGIMQLDPEVARSLLTHRSESMTLQKSNEEILKLIEELTPREKEVLMLLSQALDNKQIARRLNVAEQTARNYISIIYSKLNVSHRVEIVKILDRLGY